MGVVVLRDKIVDTPAYTLVLVERCSEALGVGKYVINVSTVVPDSGEGKLLADCLVKLRLGVWSISAEGLEVRGG